MFRSKYPREMLNEIKWRFDLGKCRIHYIHRGAPGNVKVVNGNAILDLGRGFLIIEGDVQNVSIPYHRIFRIDFEDRTIFYRPEKDPGNRTCKKDYCLG